MSSVPMSMTDLEKITSQVAQELLEDWAINDRYEEKDSVQATHNAVSDTVFVINSFMEKFNNLMIEESTKQKLIN
jgi:hypothetical protein